MSTSLSIKCSTNCAIIIPPCECANTITFSLVCNAFFNVLYKCCVSLSNILKTKGCIDDAITIRCTGFRNKDLMESLREQGYDADDNASVTKTTDILLVPIEGHSSSKMKKAGPNTLIVPVTDFINDQNKYLQIIKH